MQTVLSTAQTYASGIEGIRTKRGRLPRGEELPKLEISSRFIERIRREHANELADGLSFGIGDTKFLDQITSKRVRLVADWFFTRAVLESREDPTLTQVRILAERMLRHGREFERQGLLEHARACYDEASAGFARLADARRAYEADYRRARVQWGLSPWTDKATGLASWLFAGFGYKPFRLLNAMVLILLLGCMSIALLTPTTPDHAVMTALAAYFGLIGLADMALTPFAVQITIFLLAAASIIINSVFLTLLARRWFRL
jgi:hypothetical protein